MAVVSVCHRLLNVIDYLGQELKPRLLLRNENCLDKTSF